ncbi:MAG TPA: extracellular solute-binding protein [Acidimicrobiales bacterium]|nr:extracellular solute-binding protein [Acidimicrobiales bacterium]
MTRIQDNPVHPFRPQARVLAGALMALAGVAVASGATASVAPHAQKSATKADTSLTGSITVDAALTTQGGAGFANAFKLMYPNIRVTMVTAGTGSLETQLLAQQATGHIQADVVLFADPTDMDTIATKGILGSWRPSLNGRKVPAGYSGKDWAGAFTFETVMVEHPGMANPPQKWSDLTSTALKGQVAIGSASYSGTTFGWASELRTIYGWNYFKTLKANGVRVEQSTTTTGTDVASGKVLVGVTLDSVARSLLAQHADVSVVWPKDGTVPCPATVGITKGTANGAAAKAFVTWLVSRQGQIEAARLGYDAAYFGATPAYPMPKHEKQLVVNWNRITKNQTSILSDFSGIFG